MQSFGIDLFLARPWKIESESDNAAIRNGEVGALFVCRGY
jgi:hypothetical protein